MLLALVATDVAFAFQQSAIIPALPTLGRDLSMHPAWTAWLLSGYLIVATVGTPVLGKLADRRGTRRVLLAVLVVFLLASAAAATAPNAAVVILCRAAQGVGGAVFPLTFSITREQLPRGRVGAAIGILIGAFGLGTLLGFGLGGLIAELASWRVIFGAGALSILVGLVLVALLVPRSRPLPVRTRLDLLGASQLAAASVCLLLALTLGVQLGWTSALALGLFAVSAGMGVLWVRRERRAPDPLIDLQLFSTRPILLANVSAIGLGFALFGAFFLLPKLVEAPPSRLHYGFGAGPIQQGLFLLPAAVGQLAAGPVAGALGRRWSPKWVLVAGMGLTLAGLVILACVPSSAWEVVLASLVLGTGFGSGVQASSTLVTQGVARERTGISTALNSTVRRFAGGVGAQVSAAELTALQLPALGGAPSHVAFMLAFGTAAVFCLAGGGAALWLPRPSQEEADGYGDPT